MGRIARACRIGMLVAAAASSSGCKGGVRCFRDGVPPPARQQPDASLLVGIDDYQRSAKECPRNEPAVAAPCELPMDATCYYAHDERPCDPDGCTCEATGGARTYHCSRLIIE